MFWRRKTSLVAICSIIVVVALFFVSNFFLISCTFTVPLLTQARVGLQYGLVRIGWLKSGEQIFPNNFSCVRNYNFEPSFDFFVGTESRGGFDFFEMWFSILFLCAIPFVVLLIEYIRYRVKSL